MPRLVIVTNYYVSWIQLQPLQYWFNQFNQLGPLLTKLSIQPTRGINWIELNDWQACLCIAYLLYRWLKRFQATSTVQSKLSDWSDSCQEVPPQVSSRNIVAGLFSNNYGEPYPMHCWKRCRTPCAAKGPEQWLIRPRNIKSRALAYELRIWGQTHL